MSTLLPPFFLRFLKRSNEDQCLRYKRTRSLSTNVLFTTFPKQGGKGEFFSIKRASVCSLGHQFFSRQSKFTFSSCVQQAAKTKDGPMRTRAADLYWKLTTGANQNLWNRPGVLHLLLSVVCDKTMVVFDNLPFHHKTYFRVTIRGFILFSWIHVEESPNY